MTALAELRQPAESVDVLNRSDSRWLRLREIIRTESLRLGEFTLSSGRQSTYLFQLRQTTMLPEGAALLGEIIVEYMEAQGITCVGGLVLGAVPLVSAAATISHLKRSPVDAFFVRKEPKKHGAQEQIDGHLRAGAKPLMVDDVATTGGSIVKAIVVMNSNQRRFDVHRALVVVDREEGAAENLAAQGIQLAAIFKRSDFPEIQ
jgi:orotate phosphoribosyltransferase